MKTARGASFSWVRIPLSPLIVLPLYIVCLRNSKLGIKSSNVVKDLWRLVYSLITNALKFHEALNHKMTQKLPMNRFISGQTVAYCNPVQNQKQWYLMRLVITSLFTLAVLSSFVFFVVILILLYGGTINLGLAITLTVGINILLWLIGPKITEWMTVWFYHCKYLSKAEVEQLHPEVAEIISQVTTIYHFPFPKVGVIPDKNPTAFSYGSGRFNARIVLTDGIFQFLSPQEIKSVVAHELGHIKNRDFIVMMIASTLVQILYEIYAVFIRAKGKKSGNLKLIALIAYAFYVIGTYTLLFLSRAREYLADEFSSQVTSSEDLATSLIKIAYGIVTTVEDDAEKHLLHSTRQLGIIDVEHAKQIGIVSYITNHDPNVLAEVMVFDKVSPWAKLAELNSTHPLTGKRIERLSKLSKNQNKPFSFDIDAASNRLRINSSKLYENFAFGIAICLLPYVLGIAALLLGSIFWAVIAFAIGLIVQILYRFPFSKAVETNVLDEMRDPYASPVRGKPVTFSGSVIGRGVPGYVFSADMMYQDKTGLIFITYNSFFGFLGNLFFALGKIKTLFGVPSIAEGWFFRGMGSALTLKYIKTDKGTVKSHPLLWAFFSPIVIMIIVIITVLYFSQLFHIPVQH